MTLAKGDLVQVLGVDDADDLRGKDKHGIASDNRLFAEKFIGRVGRIVEVNTGKAGKVGNTAKDPLYVVHVPALGQDGFWEEELKKLV